MMQVEDTKRENQLLQAKTKRLQSMLIRSQPHEEELINTIQNLEKVGMSGLSNITLHQECR